MIGRDDLQRDGLYRPPAGFECRTELAPAFDRRRDPKGNYGIHGVELRFVLCGPAGATQFLLYTKWQLPEVQAELDAKPDRWVPHLLYQPMPADFGYHAAERPDWVTDDSHVHPRADCPYTPTGRCWYDGSGLRAENEAWPVLLREGSDGVWRLLEAEYRRRFGPASEVDATVGDEEGGA